MAKHKQTIVLDFDGTVHLYSSGWLGPTVIPDPPTSGAREAIRKLRDDYKVVIVSSRCHQDGGIAAITEWLRLHDIQVDAVSAVKPPHIVVVDDRALRFNGNWQEVLDGIDKASIPWNKTQSHPNGGS